jgi:hypothetical protein
LIAERGHRVTLFERERFPRFHIGESLIPETYWVLKRLGMLEKMQKSHFVKKYSVQFVSASGKLSAPFYFWDNKPHECSQTWQVVRSEFDTMMLDNAREHGVDVHEGVRVLDVLFEGDRAVGVTLRDEDGGVREVRAKVVVDASGQVGLLQNRLGLRVWDPLLNKGAIWTYWEGAFRDSGRDEGATMVLQTASRNGWFWYIPLHGDLVSVGVVAPFDYLFKGRGKSYGETYEEEVRLCPAVQQRVAGARRVTGYFRDQGLLVPRDPRGGGRLGHGRGRLRVPRSALLFGRPPRAALGGDGRRRDLRGPREGGHRRPPSSAAGGRSSTRASTACAPGLRVLRGVQLRPVRPEIPGACRGPVTDILIGDVFGDRVDKVWAPMDSLKAPGTPPIPPVGRRRAGQPRRDQGERARSPGRAPALGSVVAGPARLDPPL